jgi:Polyketide cyclase / dehydrase and lipid transport
MNANRPLRVALFINAVFSATCALLLLTLPELVGDLLGLQIPFILRLVGVGLLFFSVDLVHQATQLWLTTWRVLYASIGDFLWVIGSMLGLLLFPRLFSVTGVAIVIVVALVVFAFGIWQIWGIDRTHRSENPALRRHCLVVRTKVPAVDMWNVIKRMGDIQNYMPSLVRSEILNGKAPGVGAVRYCTDKAGRSWSEECIHFEPGYSFTMRFISEAPDFPFPASVMFGGWEVIPMGRESDVVVWWEIAPKPRLLAPILLPILAFSADRDFVQIVQRMAIDALKQGYSSGNRQMGTLVWLAPRLC